MRSPVNVQVLEDDSVSKAIKNTAKNLQKKYNKKRSINEKFLKKRSPLQKVFSVILDCICIGLLIFPLYCVLLQ